MFINEYEYKHVYDFYISELEKYSISRANQTEWNENALTMFGPISRRNNKEKWFVQLKKFLF